MSRAGTLSVAYCRSEPPAGGGGPHDRAPGGPGEGPRVVARGEEGLKEILDSYDYAARLGVSIERFRRARAAAEHPERPTDRPWVAKLARRIAPPTRYVGSGRRRRTPVWLRSDVEAFEERSGEDENEGPSA